MTNDIKYVKIDRHAKSRGGFRVIQAIRKIEKRINEMNMKMWREQQERRNGHFGNCLSIQ